MKVDNIMIKVTARTASPVEYLLFTLYLSLLMDSDGYFMRIESSGARQDTKNIPLPRMLPGTNSAFLPL
jgi:hypothetical protein